MHFTYLGAPDSRQKFGNVMLSSNRILLDYYATTLRVRVFILMGNEE